MKVQEEVRFCWTCNRNIRLDDMDSHRLHNQAFVCGRCNKKFNEVNKSRRHERGHLRSEDWKGQRTDQEKNERDSANEDTKEKDKLINEKEEEFFNNKIGYKKKVYEVITIDEEEKEVIAPIVGLEEIDKEKLGKKEGKKRSSRKRKMLLEVGKDILTKEDDQKNAEENVGRRRHFDTCEICKKSFQDEKYRVHHLFEFRPEKIVEEIMEGKRERPKTCEYCGLQVEDEKTMKNHMYLIHMKPKGGVLISGSCEYCKKIWRSVADRDEHMKVNNNKRICITRIS